MTDRQPREMTEGLGRHILAELYGCAFDTLNDLPLLQEAAEQAVRASGATILSTHFRPFEPQGVTGVIIVAESHLSLHSWPEHGYLAVDYFTCGSQIEMDLAIDLLIARLKPRQTTRALHWRGTGLSLAQERRPPR